MEEWGDDVLGLVISGLNHETLLILPVVDLGWGLQLEMEEGLLVAAKRMETAQQSLFWQLLHQP